LADFVLFLYFAGKLQRKGFFFVFIMIQSESYAFIKHIF